MINELIYGDSNLGGEDLRATLLGLIKGVDHVVLYDVQDFTKKLKMVD
jgi:hypothetical protein